MELFKQVIKSTKSFFELVKTKIISGLTLISDLIKFELVPKTKLIFETLKTKIYTRTKYVLGKILFTSRKLSRIIAETLELKLIPRVNSIYEALKGKIKFLTTFIFETLKFKLVPMFKSIYETLKVKIKFLTTFIFETLKLKIFPRLKSIYETFRVRRNLRNGLIAVLLVSLLLINPFDTSFGKTINKQEFFLYHFKDIMEHSFGEKASAESSYYLATNTYENQIAGDLFGVGKGKNLILIQMESVQSMVIDADYNGQEITPVLNELIKESGTIYFDNFYCQIGSGNTSDAEFAVNNSFFGSIESYTYQLFENNYFYGLPKIMEEEGYGTAVFHGYNKTFWNRENFYPQLGFQRFYSCEDYESDNIEGIGGGNIIGISDEAFFHQTVEKMATLEEPYYSFVITLSNHNPFGLPDYLKKIRLDQKDKNIFGNYLNAVNYGDYCLGEYIKELKNAGIYEDSILIFYGDHFGLTKSDSQVSNSVSQWLGEEYTYDEMNRVPLIVHIPGSDINETISISGGQLDLLPTIAYLMGVEELNTLYLGQNLLTASVGFAPIQMHMLKGSFIMDDVVFEMSRDGIFKNSKAWNRITQEPLDAGAYYEEYKAAKQAAEVSEFYLYNDILNKVLIEGKNLDSIFKQNEKNILLPNKLTIFGFEENSDEEIDEMFLYLKSHKKESLAITSTDLYIVLKRFEELYSGKKGITGSILYIDESANEEFLEMKNRIAPLMKESTDSYPKLEYLGYHNIIISPERAGMTIDELSCFIESNGVDGFVIENKKNKEYYDLAELAKVNVYEIKKGLLKKQ